MVDVEVELLNTLHHTAVELLELGNNHSRIHALVCLVTIPPCLNLVHSILLPTIPTFNTNNHAGSSQYNGNLRMLKTTVEVFTFLLVPFHQPLLRLHLQHGNGNR